MSNIAAVHEHVISKCNAFIDFALWDVLENLNFEGWLKNFDNDSKPFAYYLLNNFIYLSENLIDDIFRSTIYNLSSLIFSNGMKYRDFSIQWRIFLDTAFFTFVTGEKPNPTDSGFKFAGKARRLIEIDQNRICSPDEVLSKLFQGDKFPVIFVDDFVGSGGQCIKTWYRKYSLPNGDQDKSFQEYYNENPDFLAYYCPLISTEYGQNRILSHCNGLRFHPGHILDDTYSMSFLEVIERSGSKSICLNISLSLTISQSLLPTGHVS